MRAPLPNGATSFGGLVAPGDRHGESISRGVPHRRIAISLICSWVVAFQTQPAAGQSSIDTEVEDLLGTIRQSEDTISEQAAQDARTVESRVAIDQLLTESDTASRAGDVAAAKAGLDRAKSLVVAGDTATLNRILLAEATVAIREGNLGSARTLLDQVRRNAVLTESQANRLTTLAGRLSDKSRGAAERAEKDRARAELDALEAMPLDQAIAAARRIYAARPSEDVGTALARLLVQDWQWTEAEAVYAEVIGTGAPLAAHERAVLGLVDLYMRTNRLARANALLTQLEAETGPAAPDSRTAVLRARIDAALAPNQVAGSVGVKAGYESNVPGAISIEENGGRDKKDDDIASGVIGETVRARYTRVVSPNGDQLFLYGGIEDLRYFNAGVERTNVDVSVGYLRLVPASTTEWEAQIGYKARFIDFDSYRRTLYGAFTIEHDVSRTLGLAGALIVEANDDDDRARDGAAVAVEGGVDVDVTDNDTISAGLVLRYEDAREEVESRGQIGFSLAWRHDFTFAGGVGYFFEATYAPTFTRYAAARPDEPVREDITHRLEATIGKDLNEFWAAELTGTYNARDSNIRNKDTESGRIMFTLSRVFSASWQE